MEEIIRTMPLLTESAFARAVGLAAITIRKKRYRGELSFYHFGRSVRYSWSQVEDFKSRHQHK
jgi:hypothetical protein